MCKFTKHSGIRQSLAKTKTAPVAGAVKNYEKGTFTLRLTFVQKGFRWQ